MDQLWVVVWVVVFGLVTVSAGFLMFRARRKRISAVGSPPPGQRRAHGHHRQGR